MSDSNGKYTLHIGCTQGTLTSRDSTTSKHDSLEAAQESIRESVSFWRRFGYRLWFAEVKDPDGKVVYRR